MANLITFIAGLIFAVGLGISGMTQPQKITGFLNFLGDWDPTMLYVMGGAVTTYFIGHFLLLKRSAPYLKPQFILPTRRDVDRQLLIGSSLFGLGWGLIGFCPGPALVSAITGHESVLIFVLAMGVGMYAFEVLNIRFSMEPDGGAGLLTKT